MTVRPEHDNLIFEICLPLVIALTEVEDKLGFIAHLFILDTGSTGLLLVYVTFLWYFDA